ncbi:MAG TPA: hypothetical protein VNJ07_06415 [Chitinophagales bacterium]|nr:hypothetical protein [Chitinophagales bacterium]
MNKLFLYFGFAMVLVYLAAGVWIILYGENYFDTIPAWARVATGCLLIVYGVFRFIRYRKMSRIE